MEAVRNEVEKEQIDYYIVFSVEYTKRIIAFDVDWGVFSFLFRHSKKGNMNKERRPFV